MKTVLIVTTIQKPNHVMHALARGATDAGWDFIAVGDKKGPIEFNIDGVTFLDIDAQENLGFAFAEQCPFNHYARKNIGYLKAIADGAEVIVETDDDNYPLSSFFQERTLSTSAYSVNSDRWTNMYRLYHDSNIWPRGFPLREIMGSKPILGNEDCRNFPIQQGLADENPDVDAIYRMTCQLPVKFKYHANTYLGRGQYCPFNSQNTTFHKQAFPLLYLPAYCSFRMTDIWRGLIAERICHAFNWPVLFHGHTVCQDRNDHDLMNDFKDEIEGYLNNEKIVDTLEKLTLSSSQYAILDHLRRCYDTLISKKFIGEEEGNLVESWTKHLATLQ